MLLFWVITRHFEKRFSPHRGLGIRCLWRTGFNFNLTCNMDWKFSEGLLKFGICWKWSQRKRCLCVRMNENFFKVVPFGFHQAVRLARAVSGFRYLWCVKGTAGSIACCWERPRLGQDYRNICCFYNRRERVFWKDSASSRRAVSLSEISSGSSRKHSL